MVLRMKLKTPSGTCPIPPQFGQGLVLFPDSVMLNEFSKKNPDGNGVPQLSQNAGIDGMNDPYDAQRRASPAAEEHSDETVGCRRLFGAFIASSSAHVLPIASSNSRSNLLKPVAS